MKLELFGEGPHQWPDDEFAHKWSLGTHRDGAGFLTVDGTIERPREPLKRFYFDSLEALETALIAAKLRGDAL